MVFQLVMRIIFHHIPKAAGSTFSASLYCHYYPRDVFRVSTKTKHERYAQLEALSAEEKGKLKVLLSHMPFGAHRLMGADWKYYSIVRDPVKRVISLYRYILSDPTHYLHDLCESSNSLEEILDSPLAQETHNEMTRYYLYPEQMDSNETVEKHHLDLAIENIETNFPSVGILEKYDDSVVLFSKVYDHKPLYYLRLNKTSEVSVQISESDKSIIGKANEIDVQLYSYLKDRFNKQVSRFEPKLADAVESFKIKNKIYGRYLFLLKVFLYRQKKYRQESQLDQQPKSCVN